MKRLLLILLLPACAWGSQPFGLGDPAMGPVEAAAEEGGGAYEASATTFAGDGQTWLERDGDLTGISDGKALTISLWVKFNGDDGVLQHLLQNTSGRVGLNKQAGNTLRLTAGSATNELVRLNSTITLTADGNWHHVLVSCDKAVEGRAHLFIDGVDRLSTAIFLSDEVDGNVEEIDLARGEWSVGAAVLGDGNTDFNGCLSELWMDDVYIDFSIQANREKFRSAAGKPVDLGSDGSTPTGSAPGLYLKSPFGAFTVNSGGGGDMVKKGTTALTECIAP